MERLEPRYLFSIGQLDPTFGDGGFALFNPTSGEDFAFSGVAQPDGKLITIDGGGDYTHSTLMRINTDGSLDTTFGENGIATFDRSPKGEQLNDIMLTPDGHILMAGYENTDTFVTGYVRRLNADGSLDTTFGDGGTVTFDFNSTERGTMLSKLAMTSDGRILVEGKQFNDNGESVGLARLNSDGSFDTTFGDGGKIEFGQAAINSMNQMVVAPNGSIFIAGSQYHFDANNVDISTAMVMKLNADGTPDTSFGTGGTVRTSLGGMASFFNSLALDADGRLVLAGFVNNGPDDMGNAEQGSVIRLNTDGSFDTTFGDNGVVRVGSGAVDSLSTLNHILVQSDGKLIGEGLLNYNYKQDGATREFTLFRFNSDGTPDSNFASDGVLQTQFMSGQDAASQDLAIDPSGKLLVWGGGNFADDGSRIVVARFDVGGISQATPPAQNSNGDQPPQDTSKASAPLPPAPATNSNVEPVPNSNHVISILSDNKDDLLQPESTDVVALI
jgi:uncharacterized delta-60 repeat protein